MEPGRPNPNPIMRLHPHVFSRPRALAVALAGACLLVGCTRPDPSAPGATLDREAFIATYVDLRMTALAASEALISDSARAGVLERHGVTENQLTGFVEAHGADVTFMRSVWDEVERRLDAQRPDGASGPSS